MLDQNASPPGIADDDEHDAHLATLREADEAMVEAGKVIERGHARLQRAIDRYQERSDAPR